MNDIMMDSNNCSQDNSMEAPVYHAGASGSSGYNIPVEYINMMKFRYDNLQYFPFMTNYTNNDVKYEDPNNYTQYAQDKPSTSGFGNYWPVEHENKNLYHQHDNRNDPNNYHHMAFQNRNPAEDLSMIEQMRRNDTTFVKREPKPAKKREKKANKEKKARKPKLSKKLLRQTGQAYQKSDGTIEPKKEFKNVLCRCIFNCDKSLPLEKRLEIFDRYWSLGSWNAQSAFLCAHVKAVPVKRHNRTPIDNRKVNSFQYSLNGIRVCKAIFCGTLGISRNRVSYSVNCKILNGRLPQDKRGKKTPPNKISDETVHKIAYFLDNFPKFNSHSNENAKLCLSADMTFKKLHAIFVDSNPECVLSLPVFIREVNKYNLGPKYEEKYPTKAKSNDTSYLSELMPPSKEKKILRQTGQAYTKSDGTVEPKKEFVDFICKCKLKCSDVLPSEIREDVFTEFWALGSWDAQSVFLCDSIVDVPVKRHSHQSPESQKERSFHYVLRDVRVCKAVFCASLGVSKNRVTYIINSKLKSGSLPQDQRGRKAPPNKVSQETVEKMSAFMDKFPKYRSHISNTDPMLYLPPDITYKKLHAWFLDAHPESAMCQAVFIRELHKLNISVTKPAPGVKKSKVKQY